VSIFSLYILALYFFALCAVFVSRFLNIRIGNVLAVLGALTAFGVAAFRPEYFPDVDTYEVMYEFAASGEFSNPVYWIAHGEPGFKVLSYLISLAGLSYSSFLVTMATISFLLLFSISRISGVPFSYLWFAYFSFYFITRDLGVIRLAIASHLIVIFFLQRAVIWQALTLITASLSFQYFAPVAVLAKPFSRIKIDWFSISLLFLISFISTSFISFENFKFMMPEVQVKHYEGTYAFQGGGASILIPVARNLFFAFFLYYFYKNKLRFREYRLWIWAAFLSASFYIMASDILIIAQRFSAYFGTVVPLAIAFLMVRRSTRNDNFFLVVTICLLNFVSLFYFNEWVRLDYKP
jgi:hypothetical protein